MEKSLDRKLRSIHADPHGSKEFIIADAKDADMAFGLGAPGRSPERHDGELRFKTLAEYRQRIREVIQQQIVDIVLMSASTSEVLCLNERLFDASPVTPAARPTTRPTSTFLAVAKAISKRPDLSARRRSITFNAVISTAGPRGARQASIWAYIRSRSTTAANSITTRSPNTSSFARKRNKSDFGTFWKSSIPICPTPSPASWFLVL